MIFLIIPVWYASMHLFILFSFKPPDSESTAEAIKLEEVLRIQPKEVKSPTLYAYGYYNCDYHFVPSIKGRVNVMKDFKVPAFQYGGNIFIILHKGKNWSQGIVSGEINIKDEKFKSFSFKPLKNQLTLWKLDLEK